MHVDELRLLEAEAVHIIREVVAELERPVLLFSAGKDSIVLLRLAEKAFRPSPLPFPVMHVDTGHNFPEVIEFRDRRVTGHGHKLIVASVQESIDSGRVPDPGPGASRNRQQTRTLLDALEAGGFDAAFGGARRDEERARAKERILSFRDEFGQWDPRAQRPEPWSLYNGRIKKGEQVRVFPLSNWTELDVWRYIELENLELPSIYYAHEREVFERDGILLAVSEYAQAGQRRNRGGRMGALPHRRRPDHHRCGALTSHRHRAGDRRDLRGHCFRTRRDPRRRPNVGRRDGGPQARGIFLMTATRQLLRITTAGSVDDGKSTLIGRLLHDTDSLPLDHLEAVTDEEGIADLAALSDGLRAEREQGITIDVAYRFFSTDARSYILADTPGHERYTRNMFTGASNAHVAVLLVDARAGVLRQTNRHARIAKLLGIKHFVATVNKIDLVDFDQTRFTEVEKELHQVAARLGGVDITVIPIAAKHGDNVVHRSDRTPWYQGPTLLEYLENVELSAPQAEPSQAAAASAMGFATDCRSAPPLHRSAVGGHAERRRPDREPARRYPLDGHRRRHPRRRPDDSRCPAVGFDRAVR